MKKQPIPEPNRLEELLRQIEVELEAAYQPVRPRPEYIRDLHYRLDQQQAAGRGNPEMGWSTILFITASVVSGTFLIVVVLRFFLALLSRVNQVRNQPENQAIEPVGQVV